MSGRVVVVGGGYSGTAVARALGPHAEVTLIDAIEGMRTRQRDIADAPSIGIVGGGPAGVELASEPSPSTAASRWISSRHAVPWSAPR